MSMNLHCEGEELFQTPTYITNMCMSLKENGKPAGGMKAVRYRYLLWLEDRLLSGILTKQERLYNCEIFTGQRDALMALKKPKFYIM